MSSPTEGLVPVHIGQAEPDETTSKRSSTTGLSARVPPGLDWRRHGLAPRWLGMETSDCAVAIEPGFFHNRGADERDRFFAGARRRGELALAITVIGDADGSGTVHPFSRFDSSVHLDTRFTSVTGRRLPNGARLEIASDLGRADRDLALRLLNRPSDASWWGSLHLSGARMERGDGSGSVEYEPDGRLHPILVDALGEPVVAAWSPTSGDQRWYVLPDGIDWGSLLDWIVQQALPDYAPRALRRVRSPRYVDLDLQTPTEIAARRALSDLEARHLEEKHQLEGVLREAETSAEPVRYALLYGTGHELVAAVAAVLADSGIQSVDLDQELGSTQSADLLASIESAPPRCLIEVKSSTGAASERLTRDLQRHLDTWPALRPEQPVTGGVLIVNHQTKLHPTERSAVVYSRKEFIDTLPVTVVSTVELFDWWRAGDWPTIRSAVLGITPSFRAPSHATLPGAPSEVPAAATRRKPWRRWLRPNRP